MKNDKATKSASNNKKSAGQTSKKSGNNRAGTSGQTNAATGSAKARTGHGLGNEGTVVSYEEER